MFVRYRKIAKLAAIALLLLTPLGLLDGSPQSHSIAYLQKVEATLARQLSVGRPEEIVEVELAVSGAISAPELAEYLDVNFVSLEDKRRAGLHLLRQRATESQRELVSHLGQLSQAGLVSEIKSHWLTNTISLRVKSGAIDSIARRSDVLAIFQKRPYTQINPGKPLPAPAELSLLGGVEPNLAFIGADTAWRMGYTGKGRIVCVFDFTGVDGHHPALETNWKGRDGDSVAAWWDWGDSRFPRCRSLFGPDTTHGTMMAGILVGHDDTSGDTIGIAPGADWIAATWVAWEWAADPDNNPNTTADMPDVINFSMGIPGDCTTGFASDADVDMVEALGIVVVFAAGNSGPNPFSVWAPASRAKDSLTNFAVGSVHHGTSDVWWSSSRGPSPCDSISIKPNVCAPGAYIRCAVPGNTYEYHGGTSMAAPHVSGAVAILRQYAPNATASQIKEALLAGATPRGSGHPNHDYGWGIISIPKAMAFLGNRSRADLRISRFAYSPANVSDTLSISIKMKNSGSFLDSVYLKFPKQQPGFKVLNDSIYFGPISLSVEVQSQMPLRCIFDDTLLGGPTFNISYAIRGAGGYLDSTSAQLKIGREGQFYQTYLTSSRRQFWVGNHGGYQLRWDLVTPADCYPYCDTATPIATFAFRLYLAVDSNRVSDNYLTAKSYWSDEDFWVDSINLGRKYSPGQPADTVIDCTFNDGLAESQIGVEVRQLTYAWNEAPARNVILFEYHLLNPTTKFIDNLRVGIGSDSWFYAPPCPSSDSQVYGSGYLSAQRLGFARLSPCTLDTTRYVGVMLVSREGDCGFHVDTTPWWSGEFGPSESEKYRMLSGGIVDDGLTSSQKNGLSQFLSTGSFSLSPGQTDTVAFAIVFANSPEELLFNSQTARQKWADISPTQYLPETFLLYQNYPNPFNPTTTIQFDLPSGSHTKLTVYNILGQAVTTLIDSDLPAGQHHIFWNGVDFRNREVASGVYFYRLETSEHVESKKMLKLK